MGVILCAAIFVGHWSALGARLMNLDSIVVFVHLPLQGVAVSLSLSPQSFWVVQFKYTSYGVDRGADLRHAE